MLSVAPLTRANAGGVAKYMADGADDYYRQEGNAYAWWGKGAEALGLTGMIEDERAKALMAGDVGDGQRSTRAYGRHDSKQRLGLDLTFSAPKSVSLQALVHGDKRIIAAHDKAVERALEAAEAMAAARHKENGVQRVERTRNLIVARYRHETNREAEPQLHTHSIVMNLTQRADGQWRGLRNDEIAKNVRYLTSVYRAELALGLTKAGYGLRMERDGAFELGHITRQQIQSFSSRSAQVEAHLAKLGHTRETAGTDQKQAAALATRRHKGHRDRETTHYEWRERARDVGIDFKREGIERRPPQLTMSAKQAVTFAVKHLTEREAVVSHSQIVETASKHSLGAVTVEAIETEMRGRVADGRLVAEDPRYVSASARPGATPLTKRALVGIEVRAGMDPKAARAEVSRAILRGEYVEADRRYTTPAMLSSERAVLAMERLARGTMAPIAASETNAQALAATTLNEGQRQAVQQILTTSNRITGIRGRAGTGKTYALQAAIPLLEQQGYTVQGLASYGRAVKAMRKEEIEARTLQFWLSGVHRGTIQINLKTIYVLDEAAVVPTRLMRDFLQQTEKAGARVVLVGDIRQTKAIEAGKPFGQLLRAGMEAAGLSENQRQKTDHMKEAVRLAYDRNYRGSLGNLDHLVVDNKDDRRWQRLAEDYMALDRQQREETLIVAGTNEARRAINGHIREAMGTAGKGEAVDMLVRIDTTRAERGFSKNFHLGEIIQPERDYARLDLKRGELYTVTARGPGNRLTVKGEDGIERTFSPAHAKQLSVYEQQPAELARGDRIRITRNDPTLDLTNGDKFDVRRVTRTAITLTDGAREVTLPTDKPLHIDYAHAGTVHATQGDTANRTLIDFQSRSRTTAGDIYLVAASRARQSAVLYTDDLTKTAKKIGVETRKLAALELDRERPRQHAKAPAERQMGIGG